MPGCSNKSVHRMLIRIPPISATSGTRRALSGALLGKWAALSFLTMLLVPVRPAFPSFSETASAVAATSPPAASAPENPSFRYDSRLDLTAGEPERFRGEFKAEYPKDPFAGAVDGAPSFLLQRGEYGASRYGLTAEMGDIRIRQTLNTAQEISGRGGRFGFLTGSSGNSAKFETFAAAGAHGNSHDDMLVGATGELSLLGESARFKTIFLSGRQSLDREGRWPDSGAKKGDVLGLVAVFNPFDGRVSAEAEIDYSVFDGNTSDDSSAVHDSACRLKLGGGWGRSRYTALYERTGPQYRLMGNRGPARDSEGVSLGVATSLELHAFDFKLSRYNDNTEKSDLHPRLYRYEGFVDYRFRGFKAVPLALQYRKTFIDSTNEPLGYLPKEVEEDAVSGRMNYLAGKWDLGLRGTLSQRTDKLRQQREAATHTIGFLPRFVAGALKVTPDFSVKRVIEFPANLRTDHYAVDLGLNGTLLESRLNYEVKGGFKRETTSISGSGKQVIGAKVKAAYPLARFFKWSRSSTLGIKGEYKGIDNRSYDRRESDFSLLISLDGGKFL